MTATPPRRPSLDGIRVLDLSRVLAGPWCTMILADLGAEVIKIENPKGGDDTRKWGPPYAAGEAAYYLAANRNKQSVAVNIATPEGQAIIRGLALQCDVLVENYKLGGLDKYGLDYASLSADHPGLIYCSISGYGRTGPRAAEPGYDYVIQAEAGLMSFTGEVEGAPMKAGVAVADLFTGMAAAQAILAAIIAQKRDGLGQHIDMALYDCQLAMLANIGSSVLVSGDEPRRYGNGHPTVVPYQLFKTSDGEVVIAVGNDGQFAHLCNNLLGRPEIAADPRFVTNSDRVVHRVALNDVLVPLIAAKPTHYWLEGLKAAGVPAGAVRSVGTVLAAPETAARGMVGKVAHPTAGEVSLIASPLKLSGTPPVTMVAPPLLGEHTQEVLRRFGLAEMALGGNNGSATS